MGKFKKESNRRERQGKADDGMSNVRSKGENFYRTAKKVKTLNMFKSGKAQRNAEGKITKAAAYQSREKNPVARIEPNRKWFNNTRVIAQDSLQHFRDAVAAKQKDPYSFLLKQNKLPMSLIRDNSDQKNGLKQHAAKMTVASRPFEDTFGPKAQRKRVKLDVNSLEDMVGKSEKMREQYLERREKARMLSGAGDESTAANAEDGYGNAREELDEIEQEADGSIGLAREAIFSKGQSKRIWNELYKVIDSSDVLIQVLDARDPEGTRCRHVEKYVQTEAAHKHILLILNKCDLVPTKVAASWVRSLSKEYPTLAFHSSITNSFGKGSLIQVLRQFSQLHANRKQISVGFIGYPNTGKSSIINTLRKKKVCKTAPIPGETKVWQYITLMKRIYLIDCPGVVPPSPTDSDATLLLRGVVRVENVENPAQYVHAALARCQPRHVERTYGIRNAAADPTAFLETLARKSGRLMKGGEPDVDAAAKIFLNDFLRGKVPWFVGPVGAGSGGEDAGRGDAGGAKGEETEERMGTMGDMTRLNKVPTQDLRRKRKREEENPGGEGRDGNEDERELDESQDESGDDEEESDAEQEVHAEDQGSDKDESDDDDDDDEDGLSLDASVLRRLEAEGESSDDDS